MRRRKEERKWKRIETEREYKKLEYYDLRLRI